MMSSGEILSFPVFFFPKLYRKKKPGQIQLVTPMEMFATETFAIS